MSHFISILIPLIFCTLSAVGQNGVFFDEERKVLVISANGKKYTFAPEFVVIYAENNPGLSLKPAGIKNVPYNIPSWKVTDRKKANLIDVIADEKVAGDGFDDRILRGKNELRTVDITNSGQKANIIPDKIIQEKNSIRLLFPPNDLFTLKANITYPNINNVAIHFELSAKKKGYFSVGYVGAPQFSKQEASSIWQPMIWNERRFPEKEFLTPAHMAQLPATMVNDGINTITVMADAKEIPFEPLSVLNNSRFGVSVINNKRLLQPTIFAPIMGGFKSLMKPSQTFNFKLGIAISSEKIPYEYERLAREKYRFTDFRKNDISSLNTVLENIVDYSLSEYAWFVDSLKGFAYSTDVPGAVKNVSSLNPLGLAIVMDDKKMFEKRAYPLMEYMLSREKFLFSLDSNQKIQSPSRKMKGPVAPISELTALYNIFGKANHFYLELAKNEYNSARKRNLDEKEIGKTWMNAMYLYKATGNKEFYKTLADLADDYLKQRVQVPQTAFDDTLNNGFFFWPSFTHRYTELIELYELTNDIRFLNAAHKAGREYAMFTWMVPSVPDSMITVNKGGKAPMYWYLKSKGHQQMFYPEEKAPAWRLSEIGLTPESSGTSSGHRGILMSNYAPWLMRLGYYAKDSFMMEIARSAIIGRYQNFPGYHINTERTTAYEKFDFPYHKHKEQSVSSFHYNHILPMASMLLDYLVTDAFVKSEGKVNFPSEYIEGYAYLQNKLYGAKKGNIYNEKDIQLWMPSGLLKSSNVELNYISGRKRDEVYFVFTNQSRQQETTTITINSNLLQVKNKVILEMWDGAKWLPKTMTKDSVFTVSLDARGIKTYRLKGLQPNVSLQDQLLANSLELKNDHVNIKEGNAKAMLIKLGDFSARLFLYLEDDDNKWQQANLVFKDEKRKESSLTDESYPFEFTIPVNKNKVSFKLKLTDRKGVVKESNWYQLGK